MFLTFLTFEIWETGHFSVILRNIETKFVVNRCKYKYWIAFGDNYGLIIASKRMANFHGPLMPFFQFAILFEAIIRPLLLSKCDSILKCVVFISLPFSCHIFVFLFARLQWTELLKVLPSLLSSMEKNNVYEVDDSYIDYYLLSYFSHNKL